MKSWQENTQAKMKEYLINCSELSKELPDIPLRTIRNTISGTSTAKCIREQIDDAIYRLETRTKAGFRKAKKTAKTRVVKVVITNEEVKTIKRLNPKISEIKERDLIRKLYKALGRELTSVNLRDDIKNLYLDCIQADNGKFYFWFFKLSKDAPRSKAIDMEGNIINEKEAMKLFCTFEGFHKKVLYGVT